MGHPELPGIARYVRRDRLLAHRGPVTTVDPTIDRDASQLTDPVSPVRRLTGWGPAVLSFAAALAYGLYIALRTYELHLGVYLRLGGRYVFTSHLYSFGLPNTSL